MEFINLKLSNSRKSLRALSFRQRSRVMFEVRGNLRSQNFCKNKNVNKKLNNIRSVQDIDSPTTECNPFFHFSSIGCINNEMNVKDDEFSSCSSSSSSICSIDDTGISFFNTTDVESSLSFREHLASCFVDNNLTHIQGNSILSVLRTHPCFSSLPKDVRTLLNTPRNSGIVYRVEPGEYIHFDLEIEIIKCLTNISSAVTVNQLEIDFNTDGCALDKSGSIHIWPIQVRISNLQHTKPIVVGIYKGTQKPHDPNSFFEKFVSDIRRLMLNGGINFNGNRIPIRLRCFIADAPARAFILNHRGHTSNRPCSKCKVSGTRIEGRYVFNDINHSVRTDDEYVKCLDEDHHKEGTSPLSMLPIGMVSQVPFEYMHLVCLGVMKKLLSAWVLGKYSRSSKLSGRCIDTICARLSSITKYCPSDFVRRPRSLDACSKYKATEFRQFLLYTGPVATYGILNEQIYKHFLFLHAAMRVLISESPSRVQLNFAELALQKFVLKCDKLYGSIFNTYNVHGLLHLTKDVKRFGNLDSFSAFPFESNMSIFRKYCRKPGLPLQQFFNRMAEMEVHGTRNSADVSTSVHVSVQHSTANSCQFRKISFNNILLSINTRDNCCLLRDGSICIIFDIIMANNSYLLVVKKFLQIEDFYDVGISSSALHVYKCSILDRDIVRIHLDEVRAKCYRMPLSTSMSTGDISSSEEDNFVTSQYVVFPIIHTEK